jgi:AraC-like DNA-binding protein
VVPESNSFIINKLELSLNRDVIHSHRNYELNYIDNGRGRRFVGGNIAQFEPGDLVLMGPDLLHGWEVDNPDDAPVSITIHFQEDLFDVKLFKIPEFGSLQKLLVRSRSGIYFKSINPGMTKDYLLKLKELHEFDAIIHLLKILKYLTQVKDIQILSSPDYLWNQNQSETERINAVYDYVFRNFHKDIRLKHAAERVNLSESAFCTFFKKLTRKSFFTFLKEVRIGYACKLLLDDTDMNISQICFNSGFNNVANFNRQFREITNMNPRKYRIKYAGKSALALQESTG